MRLIILEKSSITAPLIDMGLLSNNDQITFTFTLGLWREAPEKLKFNQIPYTGYTGKMRSLHETISEVDSTVRDNEKDLVVDGKGAPLLTSKMSSEGLETLVTFLNEQLPNYSEIVIATDSDQRGAYGAMQILDRLNGALPPVSVMLFSATNKSSLKKSWSERGKYSWENSGYEKKAKAQKIKRLFEFWWHSNSALVFGELCKKAGLKGNPVISKYEFMVMKILSSNETGLSEDELCSIMESWTGTGKFTDQNSAKHECAIGSVTSRAVLILRVKERGFANVVNNIKSRKSILQISPEGKAFMDLCHPKTFDPDLPSRLWEWSSSGDIKAMRRYINTVFSRQLRFHRNQSAFS